MDYLSILSDHVARGSTILVVGCGFTREQFASTFPERQLILSDVTLQGDADVACDAQCLPIKTASMDAIVLDQVLEHVVDVNAVLAEARRCLRIGGLIFSGVPFYFPEHGSPFDFRRFTPLGHRLLYPQFKGTHFWTTGGPLGSMSLGTIAAAASMSRNLAWRRAVSLTMRAVLRPFAGLDPARRWNETTVALGSVFIGIKQESDLSFHQMMEEISLLNGSSKDTSIER